MKKETENKLAWHWLAVVWVWHTVPDTIDDETAYVALSRLKKWVDMALGVIEGNAPTE